MSSLTLEKSYATLLLLLILCGAISQQRGLKHPVGDALNKNNSDINVYIQKFGRISHRSVAKNGLAIAIICFYLSLDTLWQSLGDAFQ